MKQLGQFMVANAKWKGHKLTLSGTYGNDGLPRSVAREVYDLAKELPPELVKAWNEGEGWNGAGKEAEAMIVWALKEFPMKKIGQ